MVVLAFLIGISIGAEYLSAYLYSFSSGINRGIVNPAIRQNKVEDPAVSIANKNDFHNKLGLIIKADQDIESAIQLLNKYKPGDSNYDTAVNNLTGVEQIRSSAITSYNEAADNPDKVRDLDSWMPKIIVLSAIPADNAQAITFLQNEVSQLQYYNHQ